jgi:hypothetical protein
VNFHAKNQEFPEQDLSSQTAASSASPSPGPADGAHGIAPRADGVYLDATMSGAALVAAVDYIFGADNYFAGLDYPLLLRALYGCGGPLVRQPGPDAWVRFASSIEPFDPARRELYRSVKISDGQAEYYFEPVFRSDPDDPDGPGLPTSLGVDEFVADMWRKGIRFGIDIAAVKTAIETAQAGRYTVARRMEPVPGQDARVIEVSDDIHRSDAPRQLANGMLDLNSFQNRFPQIKQGERLLKKLPRVAGSHGFELSGALIEPAAPADLDLQVYCGPGTTIERTGDGEFLVACQAGFLTVDSRSSQISVDDKIVSHDGVSVKTTGNLSLEGDYEEFGEVQEKRVIEGESITVHADVYGKLVSRGGTIVMNSNLIGGTAINSDGDIHVRGMASRATIQTKSGEVVLQRAENSIVSGTRVVIDVAVNCEIIGEHVTVGQAEGCAIAGRTVEVECAAPRRQSEMVVFVQVPDCGRIDQALATVRERIEQLGELAARHKAELDRVAAQPDVRKYMRLATAVRKGEIALTPEQAPVFQRMALAVGPALKEIGKYSAAMRAAETDRDQGLALAAQLERQRDSAGLSRVTVSSVQGDTQVRMVKYLPDDRSTYDLPPREIKARLRGALGSELLFAGSAGAFEWSSAGPLD